MNILTYSASKLRTIGITAMAILASCSDVSLAAPDFDQIGKQFANVLQHMHFSRRVFTNNTAELYGQFLDCYLQMLDPQHLYFTQEDVDAMRRKYADSFGDYLLAGQTTRLAEELYTMYSERALRHMTQAEDMLRAYAASTAGSGADGSKPSAAGKLVEGAPTMTFDSDRTVPRSRRKLPRAKNDAELDQVWRDQVEDMLLTEISRRENVARLAAEKGKPDPNAEKLSPVDKILARLKRLKLEVQEADREDMVTHLLNAVAHVYDPHSDYMGAREEQRFKDMIKASIVGIGAQLREDDDGSTRIEGIVKGGPADKSAQLKLGDHIVAVDPKGTGEWTDILYMTIDKVVDLIRGQKGVPVGLRVQSAASGEESVVTIVRDEVPMAESLASARIVDLRDKDATGKERTYRLGILTLPSFYMDLDNGEVHCAADVKQLLRRMNQEGVQGLVMDLRFNGGGSLEEVRKMVGFFTGAGHVVQVKGSRGRVERLSVSGRPIFTGEMVVLTNKLSASASEIFAGAMADYGRAVIVGDSTTFGKGTVQEPRGLAEFMGFGAREGCGMIKVTTQKFYRINGASTQLKGVSSDIVLPSVTAGLQLGEAEQDYAMPYDSIIPTSNYVQSPRIARILPKLKDLSQARVSKDKDMQNNVWYTNYRRRLLEENSLSLNKETRRAQNEELRNFNKAAAAERKERYAAMAEQDKEHLTVYRLNLADVKNPELVPATKEDKEKFMKENKDPEDELTESVDYPSTLDPIMREALYIVRDMIDLIGL